jgi:hypothetical protein
LFAAACAAASARRLAAVVSPTSVDHTVLLELADTPEGLGAALTAAGGWEQDLAAAAQDGDAHRRDALVGEQLTEFQERVDRWAGIPRVCARLSTSMGFLCACIALLEGLSLPADDTEGFSEGLHGALMSALGSLALGIAGTSFCVAVHFRARRLRLVRTAAVDRLVGQLLAPRTFS